MSVVLELRNVSKIMGKKTLVEDISFTINKGEIFGFLGPNGAGKTTTIKMITGLYKISKGEIYIDGYSIKKDFEKALSGVGGIIENPEMYGNLTGMDNLKIYARMHGGISKERVDEVVKLVKLGNRINDKVSKYSLGMRQRLGVAQALLHKPKLLILDEPTNGLDPMGIKELRETLRELSDKEGLAVMVSSHLLSEMELMCDRFGIIDGGKVVDMKDKKDISKRKNSDISAYLLDVDNVDKAFDLLSKLDNKFEVSKSDKGVEVTCEKHDFTMINKVLISNDVNIFTIVPITKTLEEEFMEITKGSKDQIR